MKWCPLTRRQFLQGAGTALALPLLESLLPRAVWAEAVAGKQKTFVGISAYNGMFRMFGPNSDLLPATNAGLGSIPGFNAFMPTGKHKIHYKDLAAIRDENGGRISTIIDAKYNPYLSKMLMMQGFDYACLGWAHHKGHFGNQGKHQAGSYRAPHVPSIDQVMAYSPNFYKNPALIGRSVSFSAQAIEPFTYQKKDKDGNLLFDANGNPILITENRTMRDTFGATSFTFENPFDKFNSNIIQTPMIHNPVALWDKYFGALDKPINGVKKTLVDSIIEDYRRIKNGSRLGTEDKEKLERHIAFIQEAQKEVLAVGDMCSYTRPSGSFNSHLVTDYEAQKRLYMTMNSVITSLVACGLCHSFMGASMMLYSTGEGQWHNWAHSSYSSDKDIVSDEVAYSKLIEQNRAVLDVMCLDLVKKLDAVKELDNSLIVWVQEHSKKGHDGWGVPMIMFGGAGGTLKTGQYIDYRRIDTSPTPYYDDRSSMRPGFLMNQAWATMLRAMDVPPSEFEKYNKPENANTIFAGVSGYGTSKFPDTDIRNLTNNYPRWTPGQDLSEWLPLTKV